MVALAARRATLRSAPEEAAPDSTQTSAAVAAPEVSAVAKKRRGRKPKSLLAENTAGTTRTDSSTASETASQKPKEELNSRESAADTNTMAAEKEKSQDVLSEAQGLSAASQPTASSSCGDTEKASKPVAARRKASKVTTVTTADVKGD